MAPVIQAAGCPSPRSPSMFGDYAMPSADPSLSLTERIDAACDRFEADWKAGRQPRIDDYLAAAPASDREPLRQALLGVERELAGRAATETSVSRSSVRSDGE